MVTGMKVLRTLTSIVFVLLVVLSSRELFAENPTNDVDRAFGFDVGEDEYSVFTNAPHVLNKIACMEKCENTKMLSRYYMARLSSLGITTNMINATACLREKGKMIESACDTFSWFIEEEDVRKLLVHVATMSHSPTNHLAALIEYSKDKDEKLGFPRQFPGKRRAYSGTPSPNLRKAIAERNRLRNWNDAVDKYHDKLIELSRRLLTEIWRDLPEDDRKAKIDSFLAPYEGMGAH